MGKKISKSKHIEVKHLLITLFTLLPFASFVSYVACVQGIKDLNSFYFILLSSCLPNLIFFLSLASILFFKSKIEKVHFDALLMLVFLYNFIMITDLKLTKAPGGWQHLQMIGMLLLIPIIIFACKRAKFFLETIAFVVTKIPWRIYAHYLLSLGIVIGILVVLPYYDDVMKLKHEKEDPSLIGYLMNLINLEYAGSEGTNFVDYLQMIGMHISIWY